MKAATLSRGERTRELLLDLAERAVMEKGYAATSIEELIAAAGITKSGFFYHFDGKPALAKALMQRDNQRTEAAFESIFGMAAARYADPLAALLDGLVELGEMAAVSPNAYPGCLAAAFSYQEAQFDDDHHALMREGFLMRRRQIRKRLDKVAASASPRVAVGLDDLADMGIAVIQGAIVLERVRGEPGILAQQVDLYGAFIRRLFQPV